jgi:hypothetical protein
MNKGKVGVEKEVTNKGQMKKFASFSSPHTSMLLGK